MLNTTCYDQYELVNNTLFADLVIDLSKSTESHVIISMNHSIHFEGLLGNLWNMRRNVFKRFQK